VDHDNDDAERLKELIAEVNRRALYDDLRPHEVAELREILPKIKEMLESFNRIKWLLKLIGMFLLAAPAVAAVGQGISKMLGWIRQQ
jgi:hypothetical protein